MVLPHSLSIPQSLYLHYPICRHHCSYCDFNVFPLASLKSKSDFDKIWVESCLRHLRVQLPDGRSPSTLKTLYLGGGTPSLLPLTQLEKLIQGIRKCYEFSRDMEFSLEMNPEDVDKAYLQGLKNLGVNRLSLGVQSLQVNELKRLERLATRPKLEEAFNLIRHEFENYSLDLMLGIPHQSMESLEKTLRVVAEISPPHLSVYILTIAQDHKWRSSLKISPFLADDQLCSKMYSFVCEELRKLGYFHYEVSNFAKPRYESLHNSNYWNVKSSYLGIGPGAHGYLRTPGVTRYQNWKDMHTWSKSHDGIEERELLDDAQQKVEELYLALRTRKPIARHHAREEYLRLLEKEGFCFVSNDQVVLSEGAWIMLDAIAPRLLQCL